MSESIAFTTCESCYCILAMHAVRSGVHMAPPCLGSLYIRHDAMVFYTLKDRQHRSRGCCAFSLIVHKPKGVGYHTIYQMKAPICLYPLILIGKWLRVY